MLNWGLRQTEGAYKTATFSGLLATVAAGTATLGHLWACRWSPGTDPRQFAIVQRIRVRAFTISGYTAAQEVLLGLYKLTGYTSAHTGGVASIMQKKRAAMPAAAMTGRMANTAALTAGTHTIGDTFMSASYAELAAAATVPKGQIDMMMTTEDFTEHPIILTADEGLLLRNEILMGAGGTMRVNVEFDWLETERQVGTVLGLGSA